MLRKWLYLNKSTPMSGLLQHMFRLGLSLSVLDREIFVEKVAGFLEQYRDNPEQMEKLANGLFQYLQDMKHRMDMKDSVQSAVDGANLPSSNEVKALTEAIEKLTREIEQQNQNRS